MRLVFIALLALWGVAAPAIHLPHHRSRCRVSAVVRSVARIPWQTITASGVAAGTVIAAAKIGNGVADSVRHVSATCPKQCSNVFGMVTFALIFCVGYGILRRVLNHKTRSIPNETDRKN